MRSMNNNVIKWHLQRSLLMVAILLVSVSVYGQDMAISGTVSDQSGQPLPGASILVKGSLNGATTDFDGNYTINAGNNEILVFSFLGFVSQEIVVGSDAVINVSMLDDTNQLDEVVVVGYGEVKRKDLTGSMGSVDVDELVKAPVASIEQSLAGRLSGVQVSSTQGRPGSETNITIRGVGSITGTSQPLFVIDGFAMENFDISSIDPSDIGSMEVLKGPSAIAIYGARGGNGVILITTKNGVRGKVEVTYNGFFGVNRISNNMDVLSSYDFVDLQFEVDPIQARNTYGDLERYMNANGESIGGIDWQGEVFKDTGVQNHSVTVNGGNADTQYNIALSNYSSDGLLENSGFDRTYIKLKFDQKLSKKFKVGANFTYSNSEVTGTHTSTNILDPNGGNSSSGRFNLLKDIVQGRPTGGLFYSNQELLEAADDPDTEEGAPITNPLVNSRTQIRGDIRQAFYMNGYVSYYIINGLDLKVLGGLNKEFRRREAFDMENSAYHRRNGQTRGSIENIERTTAQFSGFVTYKKAFGDGDHNTKFMLGAEYVDRKEIGSLAGGANFPEVNLGIDNLGMATVPAFPQSYRDGTNTILSYFARVNYDYKGKYLFTGTVRRDGSSRFGKNNKWGTFPSVSGAWRFSAEDFLVDSKVLSDGKLRAEWGQVGNDGIPFGQSQAIFSPVTYGENNGVTPGVAPTNLANPDIKWETQEQINLGVDLAFLEQRILFSADVYRKESKDLLLRAPVPRNSGFDEVYQNVGKLRNEGLELSLFTVNLKGRALVWNSSLNITFPTTETIELVEDDTFLSTSGWYGDERYNNDYITQVGQPMGLMYGYLDDGLYGTDDFDSSGQPFVEVSFGGEELGYRKYVDVNNDGKINEQDKVVIGNPRPKHFGGFSNDFSYKGFDLNIFLQWSFGNDVYNANRLLYTSYLKKVRNFIPEILGRYRTDLTHEENEGATFRSIDDASEVMTSAYVEDGSYLRLKTISLGYNFPAEWIEKINMSRLRVYVSGQNLATWTNYSGFDPEASTRGNGLTAGVDFGAYPRSQTFIGGVSVSF